MLKKWVNSDRGKKFRRKFLRKLYDDILTGRSGYGYCCLVKTWRRRVISWKDLKEVKENMNSVYLRKLSPGCTFNCRTYWFNRKGDRLMFLQECLNKLN